MEKKYTGEIKQISSMNAQTIEEIKKLTYAKKSFLTCEFNIAGPDIRFDYEIQDFFKLENIRYCNNIEKIRLLINAAELFIDTNDYVFNINPENLYYDYNFNLKIKSRDLKPKNIVKSEDEMVKQYKSLIGCVLNNAYTDNDFFNNGINLLKKNKLSQSYIQFSTVQDIKKHLFQDLQLAKNNLIFKTAETNKNKFKLSKYQLIAVSILSVVLFMGFIYESLFIVPANNKIIKASEYYVEGDYTNAIECYKYVWKSRLDTASKYKLSAACIKTSGFEDEVKETILNSVSEKSDELILDYWSSIARMDYAEAVKVAEELGDNEYLCYAYKVKKEGDELTEEEETQYESLQQTFSSQGGPFKTEK